MNTQVEEILFTYILFLFLYYVLEAPPIKIMLFELLYHIVPN